MNLMYVYNVAITFLNAKDMLHSAHVLTVEKANVKIYIITYIQRILQCILMVHSDAVRDIV